MTAESKIPPGLEPMQVIAGAIRRRWEELTPRFRPLPVEVAFIHEASERADQLLEKYFGGSVVVIDGKRVRVHHGLMPKGDEALEVAACDRLNERESKCRSPDLVRLTR